MCGNKPHSFNIVYIVLGGLWEDGRENLPIMIDNSLLARSSTILQVNPKYDGCTDTGVMSR